MDLTEPLSRAPGVLELGGRRFVILPPTPRDMLAVNARMKELAQSKCLSPLDYALSHTHLAGAALELAVTQALKLGSGKGVRPDPDAVWDEFTSVEGVRWRAWYHISRAHKEFALEEVAQLVTADNVFEVAESLDAALKFQSLDPKKKTEETPGSGVNS